MQPHACGAVGAGAPGWGPVQDSPHGDVRGDAAAGASLHLGGTGAPGARGLFVLPQLSE